jgi:type II secretory pathway component PulJ
LLHCSPRGKGCKTAANARRGFTLVELMISSTLVMLVLSSVVAISYAVTEGWQATENAQLLQVSTYQASAQVYKLLRSANYVGIATADNQQVVTAGTVSSAAGAGAEAIFWTDDAGADGKIQASEITLIEHNLGDQTLKLYQIPKTASNATVRFLTADLSTSAKLSAFKNCPNVTSRLLASGMSSAAFRVYYTNDNNNRQSVDFQFTIGRDKQTRSEFGTAVLRSPIKPNDT